METIDAVTATLMDRIKRLEVEITNIEDSAKIYASSAEELARYQREAKVAEATYKVLIEQVKSQSLAAGFKRNSFQIFEYATPPIKPASPNILLILIISAAIGLIIGCTLAFINSLRKGVYYTKTAIFLNVSLIFY